MAASAEQTPLRLRALDRRHCVSAVNGYRSSTCDADTLVRERLGSVYPARPDGLLTSALLRIAEGRSQFVTRGGE